MGNRCYRIQSVRTKAVSVCSSGFTQQLSDQSYHLRPSCFKDGNQYMLDKAFETIPNRTGLILHSDQGWQYQNKHYRQMLKQKGIRQRMSPKGNCLDNAIMENFFGLLKSELFYLQKFQSIEHFKQELMEYLDYYNNLRIKAKLKGLPPAIYRQQALLAS